MKIQLDLNPMSKLPLYDTNFGRNIYIYTNDSVYLYTFYGEDKVIVNCGYLYTWEKIKHKAIGWTYNDIELEIKKDTEVKEEEPEQLTIADLIKEAKENGFKYIAQFNDGAIIYCLEKPEQNDVMWYNDSNSNRSIFIEFNVKKWYEGDWTNSLIEVK